MTVRTIQAVRQKSGMFAQLENENLTYTINWAGELGTDSISTSAWTAEDGGTISGEATSGNEVTARFTASPGRYRVTNQITTAGGDTREQQIEIVVRVNDAYNRDYQ